MTLWLFLLAQTFDGLFTYAAVRSYGVIAEGNAVLQAHGVEKPSADRIFT